MKKTSIINFLPFLLPIISILLLILTNFIESCSRESSLYSIVGLVSIMFFFLGWLPSIGLSVFVLIKNTRKDSKDSIGKALGITGIIVAAVWFLFILIAFTFGQSI